MTVEQSSLDTAELSFPASTAKDERSPSVLFTQTGLFMGRTLRRLSRDRAAIFQSLLYPALMLLMFRVVLGNSIDATSAITGQRGVYGTVPMMCLIGAMSGSSISAMAILADQRDGLLGRFATMPTHPAADLLGRLLADAIRIVLTIAAIILVGLLVGFRFERGLVMGLGMPLVILGFGLSFTVVVTAIATSVKGAQLVGLVMVATTLLMFFNTGFVPLMAYPTWLQDVVANQPVSCAINAIRALTDSKYIGGLTDPLLKTVAWSVGGALIAFAPAIRGYRKTAAA